MTNSNCSGNPIDRRSFLGQMAAGGLAAGSAGSKTLPTIRLGKHAVTRLIAGSNPMGGYAHSVPKLDAIMRDWFTPERTFQFVQRCEQEGINTWQAGMNGKVLGALRAAWERDSKMQWICLTAELDTAQWKELAAMKPIAVVHHGESTDRMFRAGGQDKIRDFLKKVHDLGLLAGISSHNPDNIASCEDSGWEQDLYMTCFYNIRRDQDKVQSGLGDLPVDELYLRGDPQRMTKVVRQVKRPCLGFKILAAGRLCGNLQSIERAFSFAYANIKPADAVIVGMFPILADEVAQDAEIARKYSQPA